jgi:hypothetical protein
MAKLNGKEILLAAVQGKDGKSAYEIWLEQGNTGTEEDFLASLRCSAEDLIDTSQFVKSTTLQNKVYVRNHEKDTVIGYTTAVQGGCFVIRGWDGEISMPVPMSQKEGDYAVSQQYCDLVYSKKLYRHNISLLVGNGKTFYIKYISPWLVGYTLDQLRQMSLIFENETMMMVDTGVSPSTANCICVQSLMVDRDGYVQAVYNLATQPEKFASPELVYEEVRLVQDRVEEL